MAYVPGFQYDIFVSYAHGDDRIWINGILDRLRPALKRLLGIEAEIWLDEDHLRKSRDFQADIPNSVKESAVFVLFTSPTYIRSQYCVEEECAAFQETIPARRKRFSSAEFASDLFALRCPILPVENNEHWELFPGLSDIPFCDAGGTYPVGATLFENSLRLLLSEITNILKRMRNDSTPVFLYPFDPGPELADARKLLAAELAAQSYRILPDRLVNLPGQLREASLSVFLLGANHDETTQKLTEVAAQQDKPWIVWSSPAAEQGDDIFQLGLCRHLEQLESPKKRFLSATISAAKVKEEVFAVLRPDARVVLASESKPRVYLIWNSRDRLEKGHAGQIILAYYNEFHFEYSDNDPTLHNQRLAQSDAVLLIWGNADETWCSSEFEQMVRMSRHALAKGLCLFEPKESKAAAVSRIRESFGDMHIAEQYGSKFDPSRLEEFFNPLRRGSAAKSTQP
jgi:hypothetical protein